MHRSGASQLALLPPLLSFTKTHHTYTIMSPKALYTAFLNV